MCYDSDSCRNNFCLRLLIFGGLFLLFGIIGLLCFTAGYVNNTNFNYGLTKTSCVTNSTYVVADTCSYTCNCDNNGKNCNTCYYTCYDGYVVAIITGITLGSPFEVVGNLKQYSDVSAYLNTNYPIRSSFSCYYNSNANITGQVQIYLNPKDAQSSYIAGLVFCGFAATVLLIWIIIELFAFLPLVFEGISNAISDCCDTCRRKRAVKQAKHDLEQAIEDKKAQSYKPSSEDFLPPQLSSDEQIVPSAPPLTESSKIYI